MEQINSATFDPALVLVGADVGIALDAGPLVTRICSSFLCTEELQEARTCSRASALRAWSPLSDDTPNSCSAVVEEISDSLVRFIEERPSTRIGDHGGVEWHFALEPRACVLTTLSRQTDSGTPANPDALANITILCHKQLRKWIGGISLVLDGHVLDWAAHDPSQPEDPRVLVFPSFVMQAPLLVRWLSPTADLRIVLHLRALSGQHVRPAHATFSADAVYFDAAAVTSLLARARSSLDPAVACWACNSGQQPLLLVPSGAAAATATVSCATDPQNYTLLAYPTFLSELPGHMSLLLADDKFDEEFGTFERPGTIDDALSAMYSNTTSEEDPDPQTVLPLPWHAWSNWGHKETTKQARKKKGKDEEEEEARVSLLWDQSIRIAEQQHERVDQDRQSRQDRADKGDNGDNGDKEDNEDNANMQQWMATRLAIEDLRRAHASLASDSDGCIGGLVVYK